MLGFFLCDEFGYNPDMRLVVGLGNPGSKYEETRHNVGFMWCDDLVRINHATFQDNGKFFSEVTRIGGSRSDVWILKPQTFMNESGRAVSAFCRFYDIAPSEIMVVHDELDLSPGVVKIKKGGGHGGHNGLKDIAKAIGSDFWRLRIGIGHPGDKKMVSDFVLHRPTKEEGESLRGSFDRSLELQENILVGDMDTAMLKLHSSNPKH